MERSAKRYRRFQDRVSSTPRSVPDLPILKYASDILDLVAQNPVVIICGETGCGKSTQVPQLIHSLDPNAPLLVGEPRRLAAKTLAARVAMEMSCQLGSTVGYELGRRGPDRSCSGPRTQILYCTTGILVQRLAHKYRESLDRRKPAPISPRMASRCTYVIIDEVHERTIDTDVSLGFCKLLLQLHANIKVVIMSATMDSALFANYFSDTDCAKTVTNIERKCTDGPAPSSSSKLDYTALTPLPSVWPAPPLKSLHKIFPSLNHNLSDYNLMARKEKSNLPAAEEAPIGSNEKADAVKHSTEEHNATHDGSSSSEFCVEKNIASSEAVFDDVHEVYNSTTDSIASISQFWELGNYNMSDFARRIMKAEDTLEKAAILSGFCQDQYERTKWIDAEANESDRNLRNNDGFGPTQDWAARASENVTAMQPVSTPITPPGCPIITIPGKTFPVRILNLEDFSHWFKPFQRQNILHIFEKHFFGSGRPASLNLSIVDAGALLMVALSGWEDFAPECPTWRQVQRIWPAESHTSYTILAILPGKKELDFLEDAISLLYAPTINEHNGDNNRKLPLPPKPRVVQIHGLSSLSAQEAVFNPPKHGVQIVLATNVAETALTVPNVIFVVDFCLVKEGYTENHVKALGLQWTNRASLKQRSGRAGRVCPGMCFRLIPAAFEAYLREEAVPEIKRAPIEKVLLQMLLSGSEDVCKLFDAFILPPRHDAIRQAIRSLETLGGLRPLREYSSGDPQSRLTTTDFSALFGDMPIIPQNVNLILMFGVFGFFRLSPAVVAVEEAENVAAICDKNTSNGSLRWLAMKLALDEGYKSDLFVLARLIQCVSESATSYYKLNRIVDSFSEKFNINTKVLTDCVLIYQDVRRRLENAFPRLIQRRSESGDFFRFDDESSSDQCITSAEKHLLLCVALSGSYFIRFADREPTVNATSEIVSLELHHLAYDSLLADVLIPIGVKLPFLDNTALNSEDVRMRVRHVFEPEMFDRKYGSSSHRSRQDNLRGGKTDSSPSSNISLTALLASKRIFQDALSSPSVLLNALTLARNSPWTSDDGLNLEDRLSSAISGRKRSILGAAPEKSKSKTPLVNIFCRSTTIVSLMRMVAKSSTPWPKRSYFPANVCGFEMAFRDSSNNEITLPPDSILSDARKLSLGSAIPRQTAIPFSFFKISDTATSCAGATLLPSIRGFNDVTTLIFARRLCFLMDSAGNFIGIRAQNGKSFLRTFQVRWSADDIRLINAIRVLISWMLYVLGKTSYPSLSSEGGLSMTSKADRPDLSSQEVTPDNDSLSQLTGVLTRLILCLLSRYRGNCVLLGAPIVVGEIGWDTLQRAEMKLPHERGLREADVLINELSTRTSIAAALKEGRDVRAEFKSVCFLPPLPLVFLPNPLDSTNCHWSDALRDCFRLKLALSPFELKRLSQFLRSTTWTLTDLKELARLRAEDLIGEQRILQWLYRTVETRNTPLPQNLLIKSLPWFGESSQLHEMRNIPKNLRIPSSKLVFRHPFLQYLLKCARKEQATQTTRRNNSILRELFRDQLRLFDSEENLFRSVTQIDGLDDAFNPTSSRHSDSRSPDKYSGMPAIVDCIGVNTIYNAMDEFIANRRRNSQLERHNLMVEMLSDSTAENKWSLHCTVAGCGRLVATPQDLNIKSALTAGIVHQADWEALIDEMLICERKNIRAKCSALQKTIDLINECIAYFSSEIDHSSPATSGSGEFIGNENCYTLAAQEIITTLRGIQRDTESNLSLLQELRTIDFSDTILARVSGLRELAQVVPHADAIKASNFSYPDAIRHMNVRRYENSQGNFFDPHFVDDAASISQFQTKSHIERVAEKVQATACSLSWLCCGEGHFITPAIDGFALILPTTPLQLQLAPTIQVIALNLLKPCPASREEMIRHLESNELQFSAAKAFTLGENFIESATNLVENLRRTQRAAPNAIRCCICGDAVTKRAHLTSGDGLLFRIWRSHLDHKSHLACLDREQPG